MVLRIMPTKNAPTLYSLYLKIVQRFDLIIRSIDVEILYNVSIMKRFCGVLCIISAKYQILAKIWKIKQQLARAGRSEASKRKNSSFVVVIITSPCFQQGVVLRADIFFANSNPS